MKSLVTFLLVVCLADLALSQEASNERRTTPSKTEKTEQKLLENCRPYFFSQEEAWLSAQESGMRHRWLVENCGSRLPLPACQTNLSADQLEEYATLSPRLRAGYRGAICDETLQIFFLCKNESGKRLKREFLSLQTSEARLRWTKIHCPSAYEHRKQILVERRRTHSDQVMVSEQRTVFFLSPDRGFRLALVSTLVPFAVGAAIAPIGTIVWSAAPDDKSSEVEPGVSGLIGGIVAALGLSIGPRAGYFYVGKNKKAVLRSIASFSMYAGAGLLIGVNLIGIPPYIAAGAALGVTAIVLSTRDIAKTKRLVRQHNDAIEIKSMAFSITPTINRTVDGNRAYGLSFVGRF